MGSDGRRRFVVVAHDHSVTDGPTEQPFDHLRLVEFEGERSTLPEFGPFGASHRFGRGQRVPAYLDPPGIAFSFQDDHHDIVATSFGGRDCLDSVPFGIRRVPQELNVHGPPGEPAHETPNAPEQDQRDPDGDGSCGVAHDPLDHEPVAAHDGKEKHDDQNQRVKDNHGLSYQVDLPAHSVLITVHFSPF